MGTFSAAIAHTSSTPGITPDNDRYRVHNTLAELQLSASVIEEVFGVVFCIHDARKIGPPASSSSCSNIS